MKTILYLALGLLLFGSCSYYTQPKYTKVENIVMLSPGMDKQSVSSTLGIDPYDVYTIQKDGSSIFLYHYKHRQRELNTINNYNEKGLTEEKGEPKYLKPSRLFVMFDKDGKLNSVWSDEGTDNALRLIQIDQQARRFYSTQSNPAALNDSLLFVYTGSHIKKEPESKLKKSGKGGAVAAFIILGLVIAVAIISAGEK